MASNSVTKIALSVCAAVLLGACSNDETDLSAAMQENSNIPPEIADCIAELAEEELSEEAQMFLVAGMREDEAKIEELREDLPMTELAAAGMFMVGASARCGVPME